jgi:hypothetical protein
LDRQFAQDTQHELLAKAQELKLRLLNNNSARRVSDSVQALIAAIDVEFDNLRPGVLLSRVRSIEADRAAFDTEDARRELFPDAFAMIDDTLQTARDLMALFPLVRQIEAERLALDLDRQPDAVPALEQQAEEIRDAAQRSGAATDGAIRALTQNDAAIHAATDPLLRTQLVADKLLVVGNFARAAASKAWTEIGELGAASWEAVKTELPKGIGAVARVGPLVLLTVWIAGPVGALAASAHALKPLARLFKTMVVGERPKNTSSSALTQATMLLPIEGGKVPRKKKKKKK